MADIRIRVGASLDANATKVFDPIEKAAARAAKEAARAAKQTEKEWARAAKQMAREQDVLDRKIAQSNEKLLREEARLAKQRVRQEAQAGKERARDEKRTSDEIQRANDRRLREQAQAEARLTREIARQASERQRIEERAQRDIARSAERSARDRERFDERIAYGHKFLRGGRIGVGRRAAVGVSAGTALAYGYGGQAISSGIGVARDLMEGMGVETSLAPHMARANVARTTAVDIVNQGYIPGAAGAQGVRQSATKVREEAEGVANATGTATNEALGGLRKYVALTGDLETGRDVLKDIATLSKATGSSVEDMSSAFAEAANHLGDIPNKSAAITAVMRQIAGEGKTGALEIKDMARQMAKIAAGAGKFEGGSEQNIALLGMLAQEAKLRGGAATANIAASSVASFSADLTKKRTLKGWNAAGLSAYTDAKQDTLRDPRELILEALKWSRGSLPKLNTLFPNQSSMRAVAGFAAIYRDTKGTEREKEQAVVDEFGRLAKAQLDATEVTRAFADAMGTGESKAQIANNRLDAMAGKISDAVLPALAGLAPVIERMTPEFVGLIDKIASFLGVDIHADDDAKNDRRRQDQVDAAAKEIAGGKIDQAHVEALKENKSDIAGEIASKQAAVMGEKKDLADQGLFARANEAIFKPVIHEMGLKTARETEQEKVRRDEAQLTRLHEEQVKTVAVLERIRRDGIKVTVPQKAAPPKTSGTAPAESPVDE